MTGGNGELMEIADDVPGRVEAVHGRLLMRVDCHIAEVRAISVQAGSQFRTDLAPGRQVAARDGHPHATFKALDPNGLAGAPYAGLCQSLAYVLTRILFGLEEHDMAKIGSEEERLTSGFIASAEHPDAAIHRFEAIADRAEPDCAAIDV